MANIGVMPGQYEYAYVKIYTDSYPRLIMTRGRSIKYKDCYDTVGGYIEVVPAFQLGYEDIRMVLNDEGKLDDFEINPYATYLYNVKDDYIVGNVIICGQGFNDDGEPDIIALPIDRARDIWLKAVLLYLEGNHYGNHSAAAESTRGSSQEG